MDQETREAMQLLEQLVARARPASKAAFIAWVRSAHDEVVISGAMLIEYSRSGSPDIEVSARLGKAGVF